MSSDFGQACPLAHIFQRLYCLLQQFEIARRWSLQLHWNLGRLKFPLLLSSGLWSLWSPQGRLSRPQPRRYPPSALHFSKETVQMWFKLVAVRKYQSLLRWLTFVSSLWFFNALCIWIWCVMLLLHDKDDNHPSRFDLEIMCPFKSWRLISLGHLRSKE